MTAPEPPDPDPTRRPPRPRTTEAPNPTSLDPPPPRGPSTGRRPLLRATPTPGARTAGGRSRSIAGRCSAGSMPRSSAIRAAGDGHPRRLVRLATEGVRAQVRAVRLDEEPVDRHPRGDLAERVERRVPERHHPGERQVEPEPEERLGVVPGPGERVQDPLDRPAEPLELRHDVGLALPAVDDDRQVALGRQDEVAVEGLLLLGEGRVVPVAIEPGLADGDDLRPVDERGDPLPVARPRLGDVVRLDADAGEDPAMGGGDLQDRLGRVGGRRDGDDLRDPRLAGPPEDRRRAARGASDHRDGRGCRSAARGRPGSIRRSRLRVRGSGFDGPRPAPRPRPIVGRAPEDRQPPPPDRRRRGAADLRVRTAGRRSADGSPSRRGRFHPGGDGPGPRPPGRRCRSRGSTR